MTPRIWKVRGRNDKYTDEELVEMIMQGYLKGDDYIATNDMKVWIQIKESIYEYYLDGGKQNETI